MEAEIDCFSEATISSCWGVRCPGWPSLPGALSAISADPEDCRPQENRRNTPPRKRSGLPQRIGPNPPQFLSPDQIF